MQVFIRPPFLSVKEHHICADTQGKYEFYKNFQCRLRSSSFISLYLRDVYVDLNQPSPVECALFFS